MFTRRENIRLKRQGREGRVIRPRFHSKFAFILRHRFCLVDDIHNAGRVPCFTCDCKSYRITYRCEINKKTVARVAHMPEKGTSDQRFLKSASSAKVRFLSNRYVQHPFSLSPRDKREELSGGMVSSQRRGWREERR